MNDYLEKLSMEFVLAELRSKIYWKEKDKCYFDKVMRLKKAKIEEISTKNFMPNIFNDEVMDMSVRGNIFGGVNYPDFRYTNDNKEEMERKDFICYFSRGSSVQVVWNGVQVLGKVIGWSDVLGDVTLKIDGVEQVFDYRMIRRVI